MEERARFVLSYESGTYQMTELCRRYGISRQCGYKWWQRYEQEGLEGLGDRSRTPQHSPQQVSSEIVEAMVRERKRYGWGGKKIVARLRDLEPLRPWPAAATADRYFRQHGLTQQRRRRRRGSETARPQAVATEPNQIWTADFKGEFRLGNRQYCYPLTVMDSYSRYLLGCRSLASVASQGSRRVFDSLFREYGLPVGILTDNGVPFGQPSSLGRLSRLSVWWIKLGIVPIRIQPGHPEQNASHERMHRELKKETTRPPQSDMKSQQRCFDQFRKRYNEERPHEGLLMKRPVQLYDLSQRRYHGGTVPVQYPGHYEVRKVSHAGAIRWRTERIFLTTVLAYEYVGLEALDDGIWSIYFGNHLLARLDERSSALYT